MSALANPFGMRPVYHPSGIIRPDELDDGIASGYATAIYMHDPIKMATTGVIQVCAAGDAMLGVFMGCQYIPAAGQRMVFSANWVASTTYVAGTMKAFYTMDPDLRYEIQANGSLARTAIGDEADIVYTAGNATTGLSAVAISTTLAGAGNPAGLRILNLARDVDNAWGDAFTIVQVMIAEHQYRAVANAI